MESEAARKRRERFAEYFITSWATVENLVNLMLIDSAGALFDEDKAAIQRRKNFKSKLDLLRKDGLIDEDSYVNIKNLLDLRNSLFHGGPAYPAILEDSNMKDGAIAITMKGLRATIEAFGKFVSQAIGTPADEN